MLFDSSLCLTIAVAASNSRPVSAYAPQKGDYFNYSETITVNNGQGSYTGYTDQTQVSGMEQMNSVAGSNVSASYSFSYQYSNNQGSSTSYSSSGKYTWSPSSFTYVNGTDNQVGLLEADLRLVRHEPHPSGRRHLLCSEHSIHGAVEELQPATAYRRNKYIQTIQAEGTGQCQRSDSYGVFTASYTWHEYFDPTTGYIVGYNYVEQDSGQYQGQAGSFTYTDDLYVTSTSYNLALASAPPTECQQDERQRSRGFDSVSWLLCSVASGRGRCCSGGLCCDPKKRQRRISSKAPAVRTPPPFNAWGIQD